MKVPTNTELLNMSDAEAKLLTAIERQRRFIMRIQAMRQPCPNCGHPQDVFEAAGIPMDDYDFGVTNHSFRCVSCKRQMEHCVPFISHGSPWYWTLVPIVPSPEIKTIEYRVGEQVISTEPMVFKRLYAVGQSLRMNFNDYEVVGVAVVDGIQKVSLKLCGVCAICGGVQGVLQGNSRCVCHQKPGAP
jgi:hypothetical protein